MRTVPQLSTLLLAAMMPFAAHAAAQRTFVSSVGDDSNTSVNCALAGPCRNPAAALSVTNAGGEIIFLDSGVYQQLSIDRSVSLIAPRGIFALFHVSSSSPGIDVNAAGAAVVLRNLTLTGKNVGITGIKITAGNTVSIENCTVSEMTGWGLEANGAFKVRILDSVFYRNGGGGAYLANDARATISGSRFLHNTGNGLYLAANTGQVQAQIDRSVASDNSGNGFYAMSYGPSVGNAVMDLARVASHRNSNGIYGYAQDANKNARISVVDATVSENTNGHYVYAGLGADARLFARQVVARENVRAFRALGSASNAVLAVSGVGIAYQWNDASTNGFLAETTTIGTVQLAVHRTTIAGPGVGIRTLGVSGAPASALLATVSDSRISDSVYGIEALTSGNLVLSGNSIDRNSNTGIWENIDAFSDSSNLLSDNFTPIVGSLTSFSRM